MVTFFRDDVADIKRSQFLSFLSFLSDCFALLNRWLACAKSKTHYYFNQWIRVYQTLSIKKMKADCFLYCLEKTNVTLQLCKHTVCWSFLFWAHLSILSEHNRPKTTSLFHRTEKR